MTKKEKQVYEKMVNIIEQRIKTGHAQFGDKGQLRFYKAKLESRE